MLRKRLPIHPVQQGVTLRQGGVPRIHFVKLLLRGQLSGAKRKASKRTTTSPMPSWTSIKLLGWPVITWPMIGCESEPKWKRDSWLQGPA